MTTPSYEARRYEILKEVVSDYLDDSDGTSQRLLDDLQRALLENVQYFKRRVDHYTHIMEFFQ